MRSRCLWVLALALALALGLVATACGDSTSSTSTASPGDTVSGYVTVSVNEAYEQLTTNADAQIVDVRELEEWAATGVISAAILIPLGELEVRAPSELVPDRPVYVICNSGNRSRVGSETLVGLGYSQVYNIDGGIQAWLAAGLPLESYQP